MASDRWHQPGALPLGAGLIAIANQGRVLSGLSTLDGASQTLPVLYALPNADFHDITSGNNGYAAGPGYDLVTGRGTPVANKLIPDLAGTTGTTVNNPAPTATLVIGSFTLSANQITAGTSVTLKANNVTETSGTVTSVAFYEETNDIAGLQTETDNLIGAGTKSGNNWTLTAGTSGLKPRRNYQLYAVATDANGATASATVTLTIVAGSNAPGNDSFASATQLSGTSLSVTGSNVGATKQAGEPNHAGNFGGHSVWYA